MEMEKEITSSRGSQMNDCFCVTAQGRPFSLVEELTWREEEFQRS